MYRPVLFLVAGLALAPALLMSRDAAAAPTPPVAAQRPHAVASPQGTRQDEYY